jgi:hypothetical protein
LSGENAQMRLPTLLEAYSHHHPDHTDAAIERRAGRRQSLAISLGVARAKQRIT